MKITLTTQESENYFHTALCNSLGCMSDYGLELDYDSTAYKAAKSKLENPCYEDVLLQILKDGGTLTLVDIENDSDMNSTINIQDVHERVQHAPSTRLLEMANQEDDADTGDVILQTVFFSDVVFGQASTTT